MATQHPLSMGWFIPTIGDTSAFSDPEKAIPQSLAHFERVTHLFGQGLRHFGMDVEVGIGHR